MTEEREVSPSWYIAAAHYLIAGFLAPIVASLTIGFLIDFIFGPETLITAGLSLILGPVAVWFGVIYSARFLEKRYIISEPKKVVMFATTYFFLLTGLFIAGTFIVSIGSAVDIGTIATFFIPGAAIELAVFYIASKKFVRSTAAG